MAERSWYDFKMRPISQTQWKDLKQFKKRKYNINDKKHWKYYINKKAAHYGFALKEVPDKYRLADEDDWVPWSVQKSLEKKKARYWAQRNKERLIDRNWHLAKQRLAFNRNYRNRMAQVEAERKRKLILFNRQNARFRRDFKPSDFLVKK